MSYSVCKKLTTCVYIVNHNYGTYLHSAIQSVFNQSVVPDEVFLIDDGSTEQASIDYIKSAPLLWPKLKIFKRKQQGLIAVNNFAISQCTSTYIMRLDADDYLEEFCLEKLIAEAELYPSAAIIFGDYHEVTVQNEIIRTIRRHNFADDVELFDLPAHGACTLFSLNAIREVGGYDPTLECQDGWDIWLKLIKHYQVRNIPIPLFYYRQHSLSLSKDEKKILLNRAKILRREAESCKTSELRKIILIPLEDSNLHNDALNPFTNINNKTLLEYTLDSCIQIPGVDIVLLCKNIPAADTVVKKYDNRISIFERGSLNAYSFNSASSAAHEFAQHVDFDVCIILNVYFPFKNPHYIMKAVDTLSLFNLNSIVSVRPDDSVFYLHSGKGLVDRRPDALTKHERDDLFRRSGGITVTTQKNLLTTQMSVSGKIGHIMIDQISAFELRTCLDLKLFSLIVNAKLHH